MEKLRDQVPRPVANPEPYGLSCPPLAAPQTSPSKLDNNFMGLATRSRILIPELEVSRQDKTHAQSRDPFPQ
jgi:hypothetical protein